MDTVKIGKTLARQVFAKRGNHGEAHLSEHELAVIIVAGIERSAAPALAESADGFLNWFQGFIGVATYAEINCKELTDLQAALTKANAL